MQREVDFGDGRGGRVSLDEPVLRHPGNPIMSARDVNEQWLEPHRRVVTVHNAGVALARRRDGHAVPIPPAQRRQRHRTRPQHRRRHRTGGSMPRAVPQARRRRRPGRPRPRPRRDQSRMESGGVEDPRINPIDGTFAITYSGYAAEVPQPGPGLPRDHRRLPAVHPLRPGPAARHAQRGHLPGAIDGRYVGLFRPNDELPGDTGGIFREIRLGYAEDFRTGPWDIVDEPVMRTGMAARARSPTRSARARRR